MGRNLSVRSGARIGTVIMAVILVALVVLAAWSLYWTRVQLNAVEQAITVADAYNQTALNALLATTHSNSFEQSGDPQALQSFQTALAETFRFQALVEEVGTLEDRQFIAQLTADYAQDIASAARVMQDIASGNYSVDNYEFTGVLTEITEALVSQAASTRAAALDDLASYRAMLGWVSGVAAVALLISMPVLVASYRFTRNAEYQDTLRELELKRMSEAALTDSLTSLPNHRAFQEDLKREVGRAARLQRPITVAMLDLDGFKEVNDSEGHAKGDLVLARLAGLMAYLRADDRAYRVGGDEFALILQETDKEQAEAALERLRQTIAVGLPGISVSIGFTTTRDMYNPALLRDHADLALYEAKRRGKNQVVAFDPQQGAASDVTASKLLAIRRVLETGNLEMWYQPIYHYESGDLFAFEALLRLPSEPDIEGPQEAFQIAKSMGKSLELDMLCVEHALRSAGDLPDGAKLFINVDPATLVNSRFSTDELAWLVQESRFSPEQIVFEVTERTLVPAEGLYAQIEALRSHGSGVALDDVGTGNSGLELMRVIRFDYVKIDRSVIVDASNGGQGRAVILAIVAFARETGAFLIAEGVEDKDILQSIHLDEPELRGAWVKGVQGYYLGEPRPSIASFLPLDVPERAA